MTSETECVAAGRRAVRRARLADAVQVWLADPHALPAAIAQAPPCLCNAERGRAAALRFERDRRLYTASHTFLRHLLSRYLPGAPAGWRFVANPHGRPDLHPDTALSDASRRPPRPGHAEEAAPAARHPLRFSLSHTAGLVAVAVGWACDVGIDVERLRPAVDLDVVSPALLCAVERRWFGALPPGEREAAFLGLWTLKEALLKALGVGIGEDLQQIALVPGWHGARAVLSGLPRRHGASSGGVVLSRLSSGHALAVSALGPLPRRVDIFDLRRSHSRGRPARVHLPVIDVADPILHVPTLETLHDTPCF